MKRLAFVLLSGCSVIAVEGPPKHPSPRSEPCTESYVPPIIDTAVTAGALVGTIAVANRNETGSTGEGFMKAYSLPPLILGMLLFGYSAARGYTQVGECRSARGATPPSRAE